MVSPLTLVAISRLQNQYLRMKGIGPQITATYFVRILGISDMILGYMTGIFYLMTKVLELCMRIGIMYNFWQKRQLNVIVLQDIVRTTTDTLEVLRITKYH